MNYILDRIFTLIIQDLNKLHWNITDIHVYRPVVYIGIYWSMKESI